MKTSAKRFGRGEKNAFKASNEACRGDKLIQQRDTGKENDYKQEI